jgi:hypothetical protein
VDYVQAAAISEFFELFDLARQSVRIPERQGEGFWENSSFFFHHSFGVKDVTNCWTVFVLFFEPFMEELELWPRASWTLLRERSFW